MKIILVLFFITLISSVLAHGKKDRRGGGKNKGKGEGIRVKQCSITWYGKTSYSTAEVFDVKIEPCNRSKRGQCRLIRGKSTSITFSFKPKYKVEKVKMRITGKLGGWLPLPMDDDDGCKGTGLDCTNGLKANKKQTFQLSLPIKTVYPRLRLPVSIELRNEDNTNIVCFKFPTQIIDESEI